MKVDSKSPEQKSVIYTDWLKINSQIWNTAWLDFSHVPSGASSPLWSLLSVHRISSVTNIISSSNAGLTSSHNELTVIPPECDTLNCPRNCLTPSHWHNTDMYIQTKELIQLISSIISSSHPNTPATTPLRFMKQDESITKSNNNFPVKKLYLSTNIRVHV